MQTYQGKKKVSLNEKISNEISRRVDVEETRGIRDKYRILYCSQFENLEKIMISQQNASYQNQKTRRR